MITCCGGLVQAAAALPGYDRLQCKTSTFSSIHVQRCVSPFGGGSRRQAKQAPVGGPQDFGCGPAPKIRACYLRYKDIYKHIASHDAGALWRRATFTERPPSTRASMFSPPVFFDSLDLAVLISLAALSATAPSSRTACSKLSSDACPGRGQVLGPIDHLALNYLMIMKT